MAIPNSGIGRLRVGSWLVAGLGLVAAFCVSATTLAAKTEVSKPVCGPYGDVPQEYVPMASRDGSTLAWRTYSARSREGRVFVSARDGSRARPVSVPDGPANDFVAAVAPDGSQVLIGRIIPPVDSPYESLSLILASTRQAESRILSESEVAEVSRAWRTPEWSPDGRFRASFDQEGLLIIPADGGPSRRIPTTPSAFAAAWSPDGQWITFEDVDEHDIHIVRSDGSGRERLLTGGGHAGGASWSPDGSMIAYTTSDTDVHSGTSIWLIRPDGSHGRRLAGGLEGPDRRSAKEVSWIDSRTLVFTSSGYRGGPNKVVDIHTIRRDGRGERRITYQCHLGTYGSDALSGSILGDTIRTFAGNDLIGAGPGPDDVDAGPGNDKIRTVDRDRDLVRCGPGRDRIEADRFDRVRRDCEIVIRRGTTTRTG